MRLHNQKPVPLSWEGRSRAYNWEPFGSCDVPDDLVPMLRAQGFPVDINPVPPKAKAQIAVDQELAAAKANEVLQLTEKLADAEARVVVATRNTEASQARESKALEREKEALAALKAKSDELDVLKAELASTQKMLADSQAELAKSKEHVQKLQALIDVGKPSKGKG